MPIRPSQCKSVLLAFISSLLLSTSALSWAEAETTAKRKQPSSIIRYDTIHHPIIAREAMVVSQRAIASQIGVSILEQGGNAVDSRGGWLCSGGIIASCRQHRWWRLYDGLSG